MHKPTIHLNGTSWQRLEEQYEAASDAIEAAIQSLKDAAPNGRDYYPQGPGAIEGAQDEHMDRMKRLDGVRREINELLLHVALENKGGAR